MHQLAWSLVVLLSSLASCWAQTLGTFANGTSASGASPVIVIGFVGGFVNHNDSVHSVVQLANRLRRDYADSYAQAFENHSREAAHRLILRLLGMDHDGTRSVHEKKNARIVIYGHSWGASETVALARELQEDGIPVLLTVQVDAVPKLGENSTLIPSNVAEAANFYQLHGLIHGERTIRAADPAHTQIIGNFRFDYTGNTLRCEGYPWFARTFMKSHIQIECDPKVWNLVEYLIRSKVSPGPAQHDVRARTGLNADPFQN
jgi:hypothetical protein